MDYYKQNQYVAEVNKNDQTVGPVERWHVHEKGILHRGFTCILTYSDKLVLQHRKHPAFDKNYDLTFSSHQLYIGESLQTGEEAVLENLKREWNIGKEGIAGELKFLGKVYYKAKDPKSIYIEHEIDYIFLATLINKPTPNLDFAYGYKLIDKLEIRNSKLEIDLAPWVQKIIKAKLI